MSRSIIPTLRSLGKLLTGGKVVSSREAERLRAALDASESRSAQLRDELAASRHELEIFRREKREMQPFFPAIYGHAMHVDPLDAGHRFAALDGAKPEHGEAGYIVRNVSVGQTVLDIGANVGLYTLLLARQVGTTGRVIAFEPGPKSYSLLVQNIALNGYTNVCAENVAVSERAGTVDLYVCRTGESDNRIAGTLNPTDNWDKMSIRSIDIDTYLDQNGIAEVDFIKMDIQGAELFALRGMEQTLRRSPNVQMIMEYSPNGLSFTGASAASVLADFERGGFRLFVVPEGEDEVPTTSRWLLDNIGGHMQPPQTNLLLRR